VARKNEGTKLYSYIAGEEGGGGRGGGNPLSILRATWRGFPAKSLSDSMWEAFLLGLSLHQRIIGDLSKKVKMASSRNDEKNPL
jgi:hypothetical protein